MPQFIPTGPIGLPSDRDFVSTGVVIRQSITARQIRRLIEAKCFVYTMPDMDTVQCIFTGQPIGEDNSFAFVRRLQGDKRFVLCLASCAVNSNRYEAVRFEYAKAFNLFKIAIQNMATIDRSLFSLAEPPVVHKTFSRRKGKHEETSRRSPRRLVAMT